MGPECFQKRDEYPPICGVHRVVLEERRIPIDDIAPDLEWIVCHVCPVSELVLSDPATQK